MQTGDNRQIDIVIAWVDGDDPLLKQKRARYQQTINAASEATTSTRFASNDEIYYNIASIIKYVPFCRHIYVVTDQQQPKLIHEFVNQGICAPDKIRIVDHTELFAGYEQFLPTFNTRSIETMLWNISELSDYFIYMNDDFFFNQSASIEDFLDEDHIIIHGHWKNSAILQAKLRYRQSLQKLTGKPVQPKHTMAQMLSAKTLGMDQFFEIHHYPHIVDKDILKTYLLSNPELLTEQIKYKFRSVAQVNPITLMNHLKIQKNEACLKPPISINYLKNESGIEDFVINLQNTAIRYGCIQSLDLLEQRSYQTITEAMIHKFSAYLPSSLLASDNKDKQI
ncbi:Stealth CR1 domain-containing protein [Psychrobacter sp. Cmf 22.2]|uniref:Stealth CR1 domain-containing protein n=1 Tax=Psychrobacter sp. Cmf 22.2 TaxID=1926478 RepID=UPI000946B10E|nr:Stealth CR1 domain-containing protein [Psychrobacter sp. Cmf 22.2]OLF38385.1 capsular polysaccharide biosynthesis protein [Psychrobacter sp. Cmf 22.2]